MILALISAGTVNIMPPSTSNIFSQPVDQQALNLTHAIALAETGSNGKPNYTAIGDNGTSHGAYQWQPGNFAAAATRFGLNPSDLSPENQDKVAYAQVKSYKDQGYTPAQIASLWNSGQPNNYVNHSGSTVINGKSVSYDTPAYVGRVKSNYLSLIGKGNSATAGTEPTSTSDAATTVAAQRASLQKSGLPVSVNPNKAQPTVVGGLLRGLIRPLVRGVNTIAEPIEKATGTAPASEYSNYLGDISGFGMKAGQTSTERLKDIGGGALELGALAVPGLGELGAGADAAVEGGEAAADAAKTVSTLGKAASAAKEGAIIGGAGNAGNTLDTNNDATAGDVIKSGLEGAAGGAVISGAGSLLSSGVKGISMLRNPTVEDVANARAGVEKAYEQTFNMTPTQMAKEAAAKTRTGGNLFSTLAKYAPDVTDGKGNFDIAKANTGLDNASNQFKDALSSAASKESTIFNLDKFKQYAEDGTDNSIKTATGRVTAKLRIDNEIAALQKEQPNLFSEIQRDGKTVTGITSDGIEQLRQSGNAMTPFNASDPERINASAGYSLGNAARKIVEEEGTFPSYRQANKEWGQIIDAKTKLQKLADTGKKFRTPGGFAGSIARKVASGVIGFHTAGYPGLVLGEMGSEYGAKVMSDPALRTIFDRAILNKSDQSQIPDIVAKLKGEIDAHEAKQAGLPRLPAGDTSKIAIPMKSRLSPDVDQVKVTSGQLPLGNGRVETPQARLNAPGEDLPQQSNNVPINLPTSAREANLGLNETKNAVIDNQSNHVPEPKRLNAPGKNPIELGPESQKNVEAAPIKKQTTNINNKANIPSSLALDSGKGKFDSSKYSDFIQKNLKPEDGKYIYHLSPNDSDIADSIAKNGIDNTKAKYESPFLIDKDGGYEKGNYFYNSIDPAIRDSEQLKEDNDGKLGTDMYRIDTTKLPDDVIKSLKPGDDNNVAFNKSIPKEAVEVSHDGGKTWESSNNQAGKANIPISKVKSTFSDVAKNAQELVDKYPKEDIKVFGSFSRLERPTAEEMTARGVKAGEKPDLDIVISGKEASKYVNEIDKNGLDAAISKYPIIDDLMKNGNPIFDVGKVDKYGNRYYEYDPMEDSVAGDDGDDVMNEAISKAIPIKDALDKYNQAGSANLGGVMGAAAGTGGAIAAVKGVQALQNKFGTGNYQSGIPKNTNKSSIPKSTTATKIAAAIANNETGIEKKPYSFHQSSGEKALGQALGKYQITSAELKTKSKQFLGKLVTDKEFLSSPTLQDKYMEAKIRWLQSKGYSDAQVIAANRGGFSDFRNKDAIVSKYKDYVDKGIAFLQGKNKES